MGRGLRRSARARARGPRPLVGFSGQVDCVSQSGARALPEAWCIWLRDAETPLPNPGQFRLDRELFEHADVHANVVEEPEERSESGSTWRLTICQRGVLKTVEVYV